MAKRGQYPGRCEGQHRPIGLLERDCEALVRGRIIEKDGSHGVLGDETGSVRMRSDEDMAWSLGDLIEVWGTVDSAGHLQAQRLSVLAPALRQPAIDWERLNGEGRSVINNLRTRARVLMRIRRHFETRGFTEVETPHLLSYRGCEVHIDQFETRFSTGAEEDTLFLAPSPELHMKRLLGAGMERIYQLGRCYRNGEISPLHNPEFTMLEWYRAFASYEELIDQTESLVLEVLLEASAQPQRWDALGKAAPWPRISVEEAFARWAKIDLARCMDTESLFGEMRQLGYASAQPDDSWEDLFHKVLIERVEPEIARMGAAFLVDYPAQLGAMAKLREGDANWAERAELYVEGIELANGYSELNDPVEQRSRFVEARSGRPGEPIDEEFLGAMECAMPPAGGMALGVDRLVMLATNAQRIDQVLAFPMNG